MNWDEVCHWIAQGVVNISEEKGNTFEPGSRMHRAMTAFCEMVTSGLVAPWVPNCERCGFPAYNVDRHDDHTGVHSNERECFRAVYEAAVAKAKEDLVEVIRWGDERAIFELSARHVEELAAEVAAAALNEQGEVKLSIERLRRRRFLFAQVKLSSAKDLIEMWRDNYAGITDADKKRIDGLLKWFEESE